MAYNEEANIAQLLQALLRQEIHCCQLDEIIVVASGCTDRTAEIAREYAARDSRIVALVQEKREGKASAINLFLRQASTADVLVLESADTLPADEHVIERLVRPLIDKPGVGMTGAHPMPVDRPDSFLGFVTQLQWKLHHRIALRSPKLGELVAFKRLISEIPADTAVDEACIEALIVPKGYTLEYISEAIVWNKGPETIADFLKQRRRIAAGHYHLRRTQHYIVSTQNPIMIFAMLFQKMTWSPKSLLWTIGTILLECYGRCLGMSDFYLKKRNPFAWDMAATTKNLADHQARTDNQKGEAP